MFDRFEPDALRLVQRAYDEAAARGQGTVGTEHLLLGLLAAAPSVATRALVSHGVYLEALAEQARRSAPAAQPPPATTGAVTGWAAAQDVTGRTLEPGAVSAVRLAGKEASRSHSDSIGPEHLLLGIVRGKDNDAAELLSSFGVRLDTLRRHVALAGARPPASIEIPEPDQPVDLRPHGRRRPVRGLLAIGVGIGAGAALAAMLVGLIGAVADLSEPRHQPAAEWARSWAVYVAVAVATTLATHWGSVRRVLRRRSLAFLAEELFDREAKEPPGWAPDGRDDLAAYAAVVPPTRFVARWSVRVRTIALLTGGICLWATATTGRTDEWTAWGVASGVSALVAHLLWRRTKGFTTGSFAYPVASTRLRVVLARALHRALSAFAGVVMLLPVIALQVHLLASSDGWGRLSDGRWHDVTAWSDELTRAVGGSPLLAGLLLFAAPLLLVVVLHRATARLLATDAGDLQLPPDCPPALYLRSWATDAIATTVRPSGGRFLDAVVPSQRTNFTESLARNLSFVAPLVQLGEPGTKHQSGVGSLWASTDSWRAMVAHHSERAAFTVFAAHETPPPGGLSWELLLIGTGDVTGRVVIVLPPAFDIDRAFEPDGFFTVASRLPIFQGLSDARPTRWTLLMVRQEDGSWRCSDSSVADDAAYAFALLDLLLDDHYERWENGVLGATDFPSTLAAQRFVGAVASGFGWNQPLAQGLAWMAYPSLRATLVRFRDRRVLGDRS